MYDVCVCRIYIYIYERMKYYYGTYNHVYIYSNNNDNNRHIFFLPDFSTNRKGLLWITKGASRGPVNLDGLPLMGLGSIERLSAAMRASSGVWPSFFIRSVSEAGAFIYKVYIERREIYTI